MRSAAVPSFMCAVLASLPAVAAEGPAEGPAALRVRVLDPTGAAIPRASVMIESRSGELRETVTDPEGASDLRALRPEEVTVRAAVSGFETVERTLKLKPGANQVELRLPLARLSEDVAVTPEEKVSAGLGFGTVLTAAEIAALPDDPEEMEEALRRIAGPGAMLRVNGFSGGRLPPKSQIRQIRFQTNPYAAEYHQAGHIAIDVFTRPGLGSWRTGLESSLRSRGLNATPPLAPGRPPDRYGRFGATFEGPLVAGKTSFSGSIDGRSVDGARTVSATLPTGPYAGLVDTTTDKLDVQGRVEHALGASHTLRAEFQRVQNDQDGLGGGLDLDERAFAQDQTDHIFRLSDTGALGRKGATETRFELRRSETAWTPRTVGPAVNVLGAFSAGGAVLQGSRTGTEVRLTQSLDWGVGRHALRFGAQLEWQRFESDEARNAGGTWTFPSLEAHAAGRPSLFTRGAGDPRVSFCHAQLGLYVQDEVKLGRKAALSIGLRNELQSGVSGAWHLGPRLGFTYALGNQTTLRLGSGVFHEWYGASLRAEAERSSSSRWTESALADPAYPDASSRAGLSAVPANRFFASGALGLPRIWRSSLGLERTLGALRLRADYAFETTSDAFRATDRNAPVGGVRPDPTQGTVLEVEDVGRARRHSLFASAGFLKPEARGTFLAGYVFTFARNDGDGPTSVPATALGRAAEWGPALDDVRHRLFGFGRVRLGHGFGLSTMFRFDSGSPYDVTSGHDANGDAVFNDRPEGVERNAGRGAARFDLDLRLSWGRGFGPKRTPTGGPQARIVRLGGDGDGPPDARGGEGADRRYQLSVHAQAFNATNHTNPRAYVGVVTSPAFGRPQQADPGRRIELGASFAF